MQSDLYRVPVHVPPGAYAFAALVTIVSALLSTCCAASYRRARHDCGAQNPGVGVVDHDNEINLEQVTDESVVTTQMALLAAGSPRSPGSRGLRCGRRAQIASIGAVTKGALEQVIAEDGKTRLKTRYVLAAPVAGPVHRIELKPGDAVKAGRWS